MTVSPSNPPNLPSNMSRLEKIIAMFRAIRTSNRPGYQQVRDYITADHSIPLDRYALYQTLNPNHSFPTSWSQAKRDWHAVQKIARLAHKLDIRLRSIDLQFLMVFMKIYDPNMAREFRHDPLAFANAVASLPEPRRIMTEGRRGPFSSQSKYGYNSRGYSRRDSRLRYIRQYLSTAVPGKFDSLSDFFDWDFDWVLYTFFGSEAYSGNRNINSHNHHMYFGMQTWYRGLRSESGGGTLTVPQFRFIGNAGLGSTGIDPMRRRIRGFDPDNVTRVDRYVYHNTGSNSNSNSNSGSNSNSNSGSNSNSRHSNSGAYKANTTRVKKNQNRNKNNKRIQWSKVTLKNAPRNEIMFSNFANGDKAVKLSWKLNSKTHSRYVSPQTFRNVARMSMTDAFNKAGNFTLFKNPFLLPNTRGMMKRSNIDFVILDLPRTRAATKIQKVVRGSQVRTKIHRNAERATRLASLVQRSAAKKRKRS